MAHKTYIMVTKQISKEIFLEIDYIYPIQHKLPTSAIWYNDTPGNLKTQRYECLQLEILRNKPG